MYHCARDLIYLRAGKHSHVAKKCNEKGLVIVREYVGNCCASLEMQGFSLTLLRLDAEMEELLAAPAEIPIHVF